jgi:spore coat protein U-like protein
MTRTKLIVSLTLAGAMALALSLARPAGAASASSTITVTATVANNCTIQPGTLAFGSYDPVAGPANLDASGTFTISCTKGTPYTVGLGLGAHASGTTRRMTNGTDFLAYEIYNDTGRTTVWNATNTIGGTAASRSAITLTAYGRIVGAQDVAAGPYTDTVTSTVNF